MTTLSILPRGLASRGRFWVYKRYMGIAAGSCNWFIMVIPKIRKISPRVYVAWPHPTVKQKENKRH